MYINLFDETKMVQFTIQLSFRKKHLNLFFKPKSFDFFFFYMKNIFEVNPKRIGTRGSTNEYILYELSNSKHKLQGAHLRDAHGMY